MDLDIDRLNNLYHNEPFSAYLGKYETSILQGIKRDIEWNNLTDLEKLEYRRGDLVHKKKVSTIFPDSVLVYEESVIQLSYQILDFLKKTEEYFSDLSTLVRSTASEIALFRLRNMLYCELYAINKHKNLENGGHVLYTEVVEPIFIELMPTDFYKTLDLQKLKETYETVVNLFEKKPYVKP
jgi:hypothetical protein